MSDSGSKTSRNISRTVISKTKEGNQLNTSRIYSDMSESRIELGLQDSHMLEEVADSKSRTHRNNSARNNSFERQRIQ